MAFIGLYGYLANGYTQRVTQYTILKPWDRGFQKCILLWRRIFPETFLRFELCEYRKFVYGVPQLLEMVDLRL